MRTLLPRLATSALILAALGGARAQAAVITDGTFSTSKGQPSLIGWSSGTGVGATSEASFSSCCGGTNPGTANLAQFGGGGTANGLLTQAFTTVIGEAYSLTFSYGSFGDNEPQSLAVSAANLSTTVTDATGSMNFTDLFIKESFIFIAQASQTTLSFRDISPTGSSADGLMENVVVTAVPEPASLALLSLGLAAVAVANRRRMKPGTVPA